MALRKAKCYRDVERSYTRKSKFKKKGYIKTVPANKIVKYDLGNLNKDFDGTAKLLAKEKVQIRHNALESARVVINRRLHKRLGNNYHLKLNIYPHHVLRENKMLTGAGADRMQSGMKHSFGKPVGVAAQVRINQSIFTIGVDEKDLPLAREALKKAISRLPLKCRVE